MMHAIVQLAYLVATALFILALYWMNDPKTARKGVLSGAIAMATPARMTAMKKISARFNLVPSQSHSIIAAQGATRHCVSRTVRRLPSRGKA